MHKLAEKHNPQESLIWQIQGLLLIAGYIFLKLLENKKLLLSILYSLFEHVLNPILQYPPNIFPNQI